MKKFTFAVWLIMSANFAFAQSVEEVVVTGVRSAEDPMPGVVYSRSGDFLLLEVTVSNDTREEKTRKNEIYTTLKNAIANAKKDSSIELSLVIDDYVVPLTMENYQVALRRGARQDTSETDIRVKTKISPNESNPTKLLEKLKVFTRSIALEGRTEFIAAGEVDVSIVNPNQYRSQILKLITQDIAQVTGLLGDDYRVVLEGIDKPVQWVRSGPLQLSLYVPYSYKVIPKNISSILSIEAE